MSHERFRPGVSREPRDEPWRERLVAATPADKFTSPGKGLDHGVWLDRPRVNEVIDRAFHRHAVVCLSAGAGAGKSVAASQFIDIQGTRGLWYRLGKEDRSARIVLAGLLHVLQQAVPGLRCPGVEAVLAEADEADDPQTLVGAANTLLHELAASTNEVLSLALDDFHEIEPSTEGGRLLLHVLATLPSGFKCLCVSRHPVAALRAHVRPERLTEIEGSALDLTPEESQELCRMFLHTALPGSICREIHERTYGWVRGVVAYAQTIEHQLMDEGSITHADLFSGRPSSEHLGLDAYFEHHVIRRLEPALRTRLCELCWLDELSPELVGRALELDDVAGLLSRLFGLGLLIRPGARGTTLQLHPLFGEYLRRRARRSLPPDRPANILGRAAGLLVEAARYQDAVDCLLRAGDHAGAEAIVQGHGLEMLAAGDFPGVLERLERMPINRVAANPWLLVIQGIALLEVNPAQAKSPLEQALAGFRRSRNAHGEMLCLAQQVAYHAGIDGAYFRIEPILTRLERLHRRERRRLDVFSGVLTDVALAAGYILFRRPDDADALLGPALEDARTLDTASLEVRVRIVRCHHQLHRGELRSAAAELERLAPYTHEDSIGDMARALIQALQCHYLSVNDMPTAFNRHRHRFLHAAGIGLYRQTLTAPLMCRWAGENALRAGRYDEAWAEVENGLSMGYAASNPNLRGQFLLYRALLLALRGEADRAREAAAEAERFFERFGTGAFEAKAAVLTGAVAIHCGDRQTASDALQQAATTAAKLGATQVRAGAHAYAAYHALESGDTAGAERETGALLRLMQERQFTNYFLFEPRTAGRVLAFAAERGIYTDTADQLARRLLGTCFDAAGRQTPLLRLELLGRFRLHCPGNAISGDHLSRRERTYVATLAGADHQQIDREGLIEALWPGGESTSANIYVVRNRLKKSLQRAAPAVAAGQYFTMTASVVRLENSRVDAVAYRQHVEAGLNHWIQGEHWQAECEFLEADALWQGPYAPTAQENDLIRDCRLTLQRASERKALAWSGLLINRGATLEAEAVLEDFLRVDPMNEEAVKRLFKLRLRAGAVSSAERTLSRYRRQLEAEQFTFEEIERTIEAIRASP